MIKIEEAAQSSLSRRRFIAALSGMATLQVMGRISPMAAQAVLRVPAVETLYGKVSGRALGAAHGFLGIPYGGLVDGKFRFLPPAAPKPWTGVRECVTAGPRAMQSGTSTIFADADIGPYFSGGRSDAIQLTTEQNSENCLVLNVLTPGTTGHRPVMVYIHGGGFANGSCALTVLSDRFVTEEDVILVGINHRLNVFGYTYLGEVDPVFADSGNAGQLDLVLALQWVRDNIAQFGGDPTNVTIFGESGGGGKVSTLLAMPSAKGLFHRAIVESGSLLSVRTKEKAAEDARKLLAKLGIASIDRGALQAISAKQFADASVAAGPIRVAPVVDGRSVPHQTWTSGAPAEAAEVALLVGNCNDESTLFVLRGGDQSTFSLDWNSLRVKEIASGIPESKVDAIMASYRKDYPADSPSDTFFRISSDRGARRNAIAQARAQLAQAPHKVYMYHFDWNVPELDGKLRAFHTSELPLAMRLTAHPEAEELSRQIAGAWAGFARNGNPNHRNLPRWEPYSLDKKATMIFDVGHTRPIDDPNGQQMALLADYPGGML